MPIVPVQLAGRLSDRETDALERLLVVLGDTLQSVFDLNVLDYVESRGDDAALFGLKVYKHERYALEQALLDDADIHLVAINGSYEIRIGPLRIGVYSIGHSGHQDVRHCFPDDSVTKESFGLANQLQLFAIAEQEPDPGDYQLDSLTVGFFGNTREGLTKWYLGAWVTENGRKRWAWVERQDDPDQAVEPLPAREPLVPFDQRDREQLEVRPRRPA